jgi:hypothetical protein
MDRKYVLTAETRNKVYLLSKLTIGNNICFFVFCFFVALRANAGHGVLILEVSRSHITTHHSREDSSRRVISSSQRPLPDITQHLQQTNIHASCGIRTHYLSRRAAADLRLRLRGHLDRQHLIHTKPKIRRAWRIKSSQAEQMIPYTKKP